jgi:hypothetical protein
VFVPDVFVPDVFAPDVADPEDPMGAGSDTRSFAASRRPSEHAARATTITVRIIVKR